VRSKYVTSTKGNTILRDKVFLHTDTDVPLPRSGQYVLHLLPFVEELDLLAVRNCLKSSELISVEELYFSIVQLLGCTFGILELSEAVSIVGTNDSINLHTLAVVRDTDGGLLWVVRVMSGLVKHPTNTLKTIGLLVIRVEHTFSVCLSENSLHHLVGYIGRTSSRIIPLYARTQNFICYLIRCSAVGTSSFQILYKFRS